MNRNIIEHIDTIVVNAHKYGTRLEQLMPCRTILDYNDKSVITIYESKSELQAESVTDPNTHSMPL